MQAIRLLPAYFLLVIKNSFHLTCNSLFCLKQQTPPVCFTADEKGTTAVVQFIA